MIVGPPATVWQVFADVPTIAACLPGAELTEHDAQTAKGKMTVKLGPILAAFGGSAVIERDDRTLRGVIRGAGSDRGTGSRTKGEVVYRLAPEGGGRSDPRSRWSSNTACKARSRNSRARASPRISAAAWSPISPPTSTPGSGAQPQPASPARRWVWGGCSGRGLSDRLRACFRR